MFCASWHCIYIKENVLVLWSGALALMYSNANSAKKVKGNILSPRCEYVNIFLTMHTTTYNASTVHAYLEMPYIMKIIQMLRKMPQLKSGEYHIRRFHKRTLDALGPCQRRPFQNRPVSSTARSRAGTCPRAPGKGSLAGGRRPRLSIRRACKNVINALGRTGSPRDDPPAASKSLRDGPGSFRRPLGSPDRQGELLAASSSRTARPAAAAPGFPCSPPSPPAAPPPAAPAAARGPAPRPRDSGIRRRPAARWRALGGAGHGGAAPLPARLRGEEREARSGGSRRQSRESGSGAGGCRCGAPNRGGLPCGRRRPRSEPGGRAREGRHFGGIYQWILVLGCSSAWWLGVFLHHRNSDLTFVPR